MLRIRDELLFDTYYAHADPKVGVYTKILTSSRLAFKRIKRYLGRTIGVESIFIPTAYPVPYNYTNFTNIHISINDIVGV